MLRRNKVPTLRMMCIRKIGFPATAEYHFKIASKELQERREVKNLPYKHKRHYFSGRAEFLRSLERKYRGKREMGYGDISSSVESIVNGWIRLSAYYGASLEEWHDISHLFAKKAISTLDFLHEGALLRSGQDIRKFARFIPNTNSPQYVVPLVYKELMDILTETENLDTLKYLHISFDFPPQGARGHKSFEFERTFRFVNLCKLVVHGPGADNSLLSGVGFWCKCLQHLDIRGTKITEQGILLLLLKHPKKDVNKFELEPDYPHIPNLLTDLTKTLQYLDMSTVKRTGELLHQDKIVRLALPRLRGTLDRVFYLPEGRHFFTCRQATNEKLKLRVLRNTAFSFLRGKIFEAFVHMLSVMYVRFHYKESVTGLEIRRDLVDDESVILFLHEFLVMMEFRLNNLNIVTILCHTSSSMNFLPVDLLCHIMPNLREIKASLEGILHSPANFQKLERLTLPIVKTKETLISLVQNSKRLVYLEVGEVLLSLDEATLDDGDMRKMFQPKIEGTQIVAAHVYLEVFRLHFQNQVSLSPGLRDLIKFCPELRIVGDLSCWRISYNSLLDFSAQLNYHNCDIIYEYKHLLYHTSTPCKEFFR